MDAKLAFEKIVSSLWLPLITGIVGLSALGFGFLALSSDSPEDEVVIESASGEEDNEASPSEIFVDVAGAVEKPGVYKLSSDSRMQDAIMEAGGMSDDADHFAISKSVNMAAELTDGMKVYVPFKGEEVTMMSSGEVPSAGSGLVAGAKSSLININSASESQLDTLPGIGPVTAQKIIENRPYKTIDDLLSKKAVGQSVFDKIKDQISVN